jgi:beta-aspartyl-peptidase (threonine type)
MFDAPNDWALIIHGGAKEIHPDELDQHRAGLREAIAPGAAILAAGGTALDAVETVVRVLEDNPLFNAGTGSAKNEDGDIEMDASLMDGATLDIGAVAGLRDVDHPISVCRKLLRERPILLVGEGAQRFAREQGFVQRHNTNPPPQKTQSADTVGCVARDVHGNLAVGTSTGGLDGQKVGRVGDVPLPGCGFYADNQKGAASLSGEGESIARVMIAAEFLRCLEHLAPQAATEAALRTIARVSGEAGIIALTPSGCICWTHNSPHFAVACASATVPQAQIYLNKDERR